MVASERFLFSYILGSIADFDSDEELGTAVKRLATSGFTGVEIALAGPFWEENRKPATGGSRRRHRGVLSADWFVLFQRRLVLEPQEPGCETAGSRQTDRVRRSGFTPQRGDRRRADTGLCRGRTGHPHCQRPECRWAQAGLSSCRRPRRDGADGASLSPASRVQQQRG